MRMLLSGVLMQVIISSGMTAQAATVMFIGPSIVCHV